MPDFMKLHAYAERHPYRVAIGATGPMMLAGLVLIGSMTPQVFKDLREGIAGDEPKLIQPPQLPDMSSAEMKQEYRAAFTVAGKCLEDTIFNEANGAKVTVRLSSKVYPMYVVHVTPDPALHKASSTELWLSWDGNEQFYPTASPTQDYLIERKCIPNG